MKAALYIRVSTAEQNMHGYSLEAQENLLRDYAERNGMEVYGLYADRGKSANKSLHRRTELLRMVSDAEKGLFDVILFKDITRWSRNSAQYYKVQERLEKANVYWQAVEQPYLETKTPTGRFQVTVMLGTAQLESENTSQRIKFVQNRRAELGGVLSGNVPLGYKIETIDGMKRLVIDPEKKDAALDILHHYIETHNQAGTVRYALDTHGIKMWISTFCGMVHNPIYKGEYRNNKHFCEPLLTKAEWDIMQVRSRIPQKNKYNDQYLFRSLIRCPVCGNLMTAKKCNYSIRYICRNYTVYKRCTNFHQYNQKFIEESLLDQISFLLDHTEVYAHDVKRSNVDYDAEMTKLNRMMTKLKDLYILGDIGMESYICRRNAIQDKISALENEKAENQILPYNLFDADWRDAYEAKPMAEKGKWWRFVLERISVVDGNYVPVYRNYADYPNSSVQ